MLVEFVRTKYDQHTSASEYSLFIDNRLVKTRIFVNTKYLIDQRALYIYGLENPEIKGDDLESLNLNLKYVRSHNVEGNFKKDFPQSHKEINYLFKN